MTAQKRFTIKEYPLAQQLGVSSKTVIKYLKKALGQKIKKGEVVAEKKGFIGKKEVFSPIDGILDSITKKGCLRIKTTLPAGVSKKRLSPSLPKKSKRIKGDWGRGDQVIGKLYCLKKSTQFLDFHQDCQGQILALFDVVSYGFWHKARSLGAVGIICGGLPDDDFSAEVKKETLLVNGREKDIGLSLVVMGGGGEVPGETWGTLEANHGKKVIVIGSQKLVVIPDEA